MPSKARQSSSGEEPSRKAEANFTQLKVSFRTLDLCWGLGIGFCSIRVRGFKITGFRAKVSPRPWTFVWGLGDLVMKSLHRFLYGFAVAVFRKTLDLLSSGRRID